MTLDEIKKLSPHELAERYPFVQCRTWDRDKNEYRLGYWTEEDYSVKSGHHKAGEPCLEFYNDWHGWTDLLFCWAEKVREVFITMPKKTQDALYITELKEKYGRIRMSLTGIVEKPFDKINQYNYMLEHLSQYTCIYCGKISKSSNGKKLLRWDESYYRQSLCKKCAKKEYYSYESEKPFKYIYSKIEGDWFVRYTVYEGDKKVHYKYDCHELIEGMF